MEKSLSTNKNEIDMKIQYITPTIDIEEIIDEAMLAGSDETKNKSEKITTLDDIGAKSTFNFIGNDDE